MIITEAECHRAVRWFLDRMGLQDWTVRVTVSDFPPHWVDEHKKTNLGRCNRLVSYKLAYIWLCPTAHTSVVKEFDETEYDPLSTLFHELFHVVALDTGLEPCQDGREEEVEFVWSHAGEVFATAFRAYLCVSARRQAHGKKSARHK